MPIFEIFSRRKKKTRGETRDVLRYDQLPSSLRNQIIHIWIDSIGGFHEFTGYEHGPVKENNDAWEIICRGLSRELGKLQLVESSTANEFEQCQHFLHHADVDHVLDLVEFSFAYIDRVMRNIDPYELRKIGVTLKAGDAITELNHRFLEHGVGYQFTGGKIIRLDSRYIHKEVTVEAVQLVSEGGFEGAEEEFRLAHKHYRESRYKEAMVEALKALESVLKVICKEKHWSYPPNATAARLIDVVFENKLIPDELQSLFSGIRSTLESGVPTLRNRMGAHGQGENVVAVPSYIAGYAIHMAAAAIVFLIKAARASR